MEDTQIAFDVAVDPSGHEQHYRGGNLMNGSIREITVLSNEDAEHRCFERMIDFAVSDLKLETAIRYQWMELVLTQKGESL